MKYIRKNIQLTEELNEQLRRLAFDTRESESEIIRKALEIYLRKEMTQAETAPTN